MYESKVAMKVACVPTAGTSFSEDFMLIVKSAFCDSLASSETASCTESGVAWITVPGTSVVFPCSTAQTFWASSGVPFASTNSLSANAKPLSRSGVLTTALCANSCGDGGGGAGTGL